MTDGMKVDWLIPLRAQKANWEWEECGPTEKQSQRGKGRGDVIQMESVSCKFSARVETKTGSGLSWKSQQSKQKVQVRGWE